MRIKTLFSGSKSGIALFVMLVMNTACVFALDSAALKEKDVQGFIEQEVSRSLKESGKRKAEAADLVITAKRAYEVADYARAKRLLEKAVMLDPENATANAELVKVKKLLPSDPSSTASIISEQERRVMVEQGMRLSEVRNLLSSAELKLKKAKERNTADAGAKEIQEAIDSLKSSRKDLSRAEVKIMGLPTHIETTADKEKAAKLSKSIDDLMGVLNNKMESISRQEAIVHAKKEKDKVDEYKKEQIRIMMERASMHIKMKQYEEAEAILKQVLVEQPKNSYVKNLLSDVWQKRYNQRKEKLEDRAYHERINTIQDLKDDAVPTRGSIKYPSNWSELRRRQEIKERAGKGGAVPAWKLKILAQLDKPVSFDFADAPLDYVIKALSQQTGINMVLDTSPAETLAGGDDDDDDDYYGDDDDDYYGDDDDDYYGDDDDDDYGDDDDDDAGTAEIASTITLKVNNMRLANALEWIMTISNLDYEIKDEAIAIGRPDKLHSAWITKVIDVSDLRSPIRDAPDPRTGSASGDDDDDDLMSDDDSGVLGLADIVKKISPSTWGEGKGSAELMGNNLVVRQTEDIHKHVEAALAQLRAAQAIQVVVSARFVNIQDDLWQEINFSMSQLNDTWHDEESMSNATTGTDTAYPQLGQSGTANDGTGGANGTDNWGRNYTYVSGGTTGSGRAHVNNSIAGLTSVLGDAIDDSVSNNSGLFAQLTQSGWLGNLQTTWLVRMLRESQRSDTLDAPHMIVYNNKLAWISIETEIPYVETYEAVDTGGSTGSMDPEISHEYDGVLLHVRPTISSDKKYITLDVWTRLASVDLTNSVNIPTAIVDGGVVSNVGTYPIDLPAVLLQETKTFATVPDGGSIVIAGLGVNINMKGRNGIPLLSDVPILGKFFSNDTSQSEKRNYMILVNARMILLDEEEAKLDR